MAISYTPLEGANLSAFGVTAPSFNETPSLFASSSFIFSLMITIVVVAASFRYAYAGILRLPASEEGIRKSKEEFRRVTYGLLGVLGLWLVLFTVNKDMLTGEVTLGSLRTKESTTGPTTGVTTPPITTQPTNPTTSASETATRETLRVGGVTINKAPCSTPSSTDCTDVGGVVPSTINMLVDLKRSCNCTVNVTGGSEGGHSVNSRHGVGKEAVDLSFNSELFSFLKLQGVPVAADSKYKWGGLIFWDEPVGSDSSGNANSARHFHVSSTGR